MHDFSKYFLVNVILYLFANLACWVLFFFEFLQIFFIANVFNIDIFDWIIQHDFKCIMIMLMMNSTKLINILSENKKEFHSRCATNSLYCERMMKYDFRSTKFVVIFVLWVRQISRIYDNNFINASNSTIKWILISIVLFASLIKT